MQAYKLLFLKKDDTFIGEDDGFVQNLAEYGKTEVNIGWLTAEERFSTF